MYAIIGAMKARRGAHTVYRLAYHFVWIPRYRRQVLVGDIERRLEELIREIRVLHNSSGGHRKSHRPALKGPNQYVFSTLPYRKECSEPLRSQFLGV